MLDSYRYFPISHSVLSILGGATMGQRYSVIGPVANFNPFVALGTASAIYLSLSVAYIQYKRFLNDRTRRRKTVACAKSVEDLEARLRHDPVSEEELSAIITMTHEKLSENLMQKKLRPIRVLKTYQTMALRAHRKTNCIVEVISEAEQWALELEEEPHKGYLWGIPISIKDDVGIKGYDCTLGMIIAANNPKEEDGNGIKVLREHGAIPFVKTNTPQCLASLESGNPIYGRVHHPHKKDRSPGGSSSGEAALIALGGSRIGIGSDLAGSIRVPAHFCGIAGFNPTPERMSIRGMGYDNPRSLMGVRGSWGPLANDMTGIIMTMKCLWQDRGLSFRDPDAVPMVFDTENFTSKKKLRVGFYAENDSFATFHGCVRALDLAKNILEGDGHEVVPWRPPGQDHGMNLFYAFLDYDGGVGMFHALKYDRVHDSIKWIYSWASTPLWMKYIIGKIIKLWDLDKGARWCSNAGIGSPSQYLEKVHELHRYRRLVHDSWNQAKLDVVLCPPNVMVAPRFGRPELLWRSCAFSALYNLLHYPSGVINITHVNELDMKTTRETFPENDEWQSRAKEDLLTSKGLPIGVMVVAPRYHDEVCLRVMKYLEEGIKRS